MDSREQIRIPVALYRGGTSKGVFIKEGDLPDQHDPRQRVIRALMGSPDVRQIDGLGGAHPLTSKVCVLAPPSVAGADIDYTFVQVGVDTPDLSYDINCGNLSAAVGVFAIDEGFASATEPECVVRIYNTNTRSILRVRVPVRGGVPRVEGDCAIDGVPGTGAGLELDYAGTAGGSTGRLLPTGNPLDRLYVPEVDETVAVSIVDAGNLGAFLQPAAIGMSGSELPDEVGEEAFRRLRFIKEAVARELGVDPEAYNPMMSLVAPPRAHAQFGTDRAIEAGEIDVMVRRIRPPQQRFSGYLHPAYPGTLSICAAVASQLPGTLVAEAMPREPQRAGAVALGHPSGVLSVAVEVDQTGAAPIVRRASLWRTARRIMDGYAYVRRDRIEAG